jgi:DNA recombination protein RmuC
MTEPAVVVALVALVALLLALAALVFALRQARSARLSEQIIELQRRNDALSERLERELRDAITQNARDARTETGARLAELQTGLLGQLTGVANLQATQLTGFGQQLARISEGAESSSRANREEAALQLQSFAAAMQQQLADLDSNDSAQPG